MNFAMDSKMTALIPALAKSHSGVLASENFLVEKIRDVRSPG